MSAAHRMPPAQKSSSQHVKNPNPIFSEYSIYVGFYALCPAHLECRQKHIPMSSLCCMFLLFWKKHCFEGLYKLIISYEIIALRSNLMRGCRAHSALGMQLIGWFLKGPRNGKIMAKHMFQMEILECPQSLRECCAIKTVCTILKAVRNDDFQVNFGLHFFHLRCLLVQSHSSMNLSTKCAIFHEFPKANFEKWEVSDWSWIQGLLASAFCVGFLSTTVQKMKPLCWMLDAGFGGNLFQKQTWHQLILWAKICHWKGLEQRNWNETAQKENGILHTSQGKNASLRSHLSAGRVDILGPEFAWFNPNFAG